MKGLLGVIGTSGLVLLVLSLVWSFPIAGSPVQAEGSGTAAGADGKQIFMDQKCNLCHDVSTAEIAAKTKSAAMKGPDLVNIETDNATLMTYLKKESELNGKEHKKGWSGSDEELQAVIDWIKAQKK